ncbi:hypothetical protein O6H91_04G098500 [Diphasiastrum complanatum]|uniref:Uncharacterized protein n=1 Tax=Diphasiastrum complanatum TaxID=34168 RepID=A0ACC2DZU8_DIPCM|nr:hypothetical protein O6H91_04G098500 [Diphasiastrum complanatum]
MLLLPPYACSALPFFSLSSSRKLRYRLHIDEALNPLFGSCFRAASTKEAIASEEHKLNVVAACVGAELELDEAEVGEQKLAAAATVLEGIGIPRLKVATMLKRHKSEFLSNSVAHLFARVGALEQLLGMDGKEVAKLVQKRPALLFLNLEESLQPLLHLLKNLGIESNPFLGQIMMFNPSMVINSGEQAVRQFVDFCSFCGLSVEDAANCMERFPIVVVFSTQNMFSVLEYFKDFDVSSEDMGKIVKDHPLVVTRSVDNSLRPMVEFLKELGISRGDISRIIRKEPRIFGFNVEQNLKPKIQYLQSVGFQQTDLVKLVSGQPAILRRSVSGSLAAKVKFLLELGFEMGSPSFCRALGSIFSCSIDYLEDRIRWFASLGLSHDEIVAMLRGNPSLLRKKHTGLQEKLVYLVKVMHYPIKDVVTHPVFLNLSLEKRIRPRYRVVMWLTSMGLLKKNPALAFFTCLDNAHFRMKYVDCHPGCSLVFERKK